MKIEARRYLTSTDRTGAIAKYLLYNDQRGRCNYCGRKLGKTHLHENPIDPGDGRGRHERLKLQLLCGPCNGRKGDLTDKEFRKRYKLPSGRKSKGPPRELVPLSYFAEIDQADLPVSVGRRLETRFTGNGAAALKLLAKGYGWRSIGW
jgi:hypothetical protein